MTSTERRYMLDTNIVSDMVRFPHGKAYQRLLAVGQDAVCASIIVACELRFGTAKRGSSRLQKNVEAVLGSIDVIPFDRGADVHYARIRLALETIGRPIGANDLLIAAHASSLDLTLVTHNVREFARVGGLALEDWLV